MKTSKLMQMAVSLVTTMLLGSSNLPAQTWQTMLDYPSASCADNPLAADSTGEVFTGGGAFDSSGASHALVLRSDVTLATWSVSDDYNAPNPYAPSLGGIGLDSKLNLYSAGVLSQPCTKRSCPASWWYTRMSSDRGVTWGTVDLFQYASGQNSGARGVAGDLSGNIFVFGQASDASGIAHWLVRKSTTGDPGTWTTVDDVSSAVARNMMFVPAAGLFTVGITSASKTQGEGWMVRRSLDGGASWTTVDLYKLPKVSGFWQTAAALGVSGDGQGRIYVVGGIKTVNGSGSVANLVGKWLVRASSDGGATWTNIDTFSYVAGRESSAWGAGKDALGNIVVVGRGTDAQGVPHWIVRRPNLQGAWQTVDDFQLVSGESANAFGVVTDAVGDLLVSGYGTDAKGVSHWIVRRF